MTQQLKKKLQEEKILNSIWIYEGGLRKLRIALSRYLKKGFCCSHIGKMWLELTVHIARLDEMMNMQVAGYWFGNAFGKQPRGKR